MLTDGATTARRLLPAWDRRLQLSCPQTEAEFTRLNWQTMWEKMDGEEKTNKNLRWEGTAWTDDDGDDDMLRGKDDRGAGRQEVHVHTWCQCLLPVIPPHSSFTFYQLQLRKKNVIKWMFLIVVVYLSNILFIIYLLHFLGVVFVNKTMEFGLKMHWYPWKVHV